jgi:hypothetical protein
LRSHPDLWFPERKEIHFFDRGVDPATLQIGVSGNVFDLNSPHLQRDLKLYADLFHPQKGQLAGEVTPAYAMIEVPVIKLIREIMPQGRFIYLLRNPIDRAWSQIRMDLDKRGQDVASLPVSDFIAEFYKPAVQLRGDYLTCLDNWLAVFPVEQLFFGFYDDVVEHPRELLAEVFAFLGVRTDLDWSGVPIGKIENKGVTLPLPYELYLHMRDIYADDIIKLNQRFNGRLGGWVESLSDFQKVSKPAHVHYQEGKKAAILRRLPKVLKSFLSRVNPQQSSR